MLKSVLALLLSKFVKRSDTEFIAQQAMPKDEESRILIAEVTTTEIEGDYTAPCSGYLCIGGGSGVTYVDLIGGIRSRQQVSSASVAVRLDWPSVYLPVGKGSTCHYSVSANTSKSSVFFVPAIGGQTS